MDPLIADLLKEFKEKAELPEPDAGEVPDEPNPFITMTMPAAKGRLSPLGRMVLKMKEEEAPTEEKSDKPVEMADFDGEHDECEQEGPHQHPVEQRTYPTGEDERTRRVTDMGPYCVECREDTTGQEKRIPHNKTAHEAHENGEVEIITLAGWTCESCLPFEHPLVESLVQAFKERRHDPAQVRRLLRAEGTENIWAKWVGSMLDDMEKELDLQLW